MFSDDDYRFSFLRHESIPACDIYRSKTLVPGACAGGIRLCDLGNGDLLARRPLWPFHMPVLRCPYKFDGDLPTLFGMRDVGVLMTLGGRAAEAVWDDLLHAYTVLLPAAYIASFRGCSPP